MTVPGLYVGLLWVVLAGVLVFVWPVDPRVTVLDYLLFFLLATLAECWFVDTSRDTGMSLSFTVHFAAVLLYGPAFAIAIAIVGIGVGDGLLKHRAPIRTLFNMAQMGISVAVARLLFAGLSGSQESLSLVRDALPLAVAALAYMLVNDTLVRAAWWRSRGSRSRASGSARSAT